MSPRTAVKSNDQKKRLSRNFYAVVLSVSAVAVLACGVLIGMYRYEIYATVAPVLGIKTSADTIDTKLLQQTYRELAAHYDGELDKNALMEGAARGMTEAAGDEYTVFFDREEAAQFDSDMSGSIGGGIGAQIGVRDNSVTLVKIIADTPAERAGLKAGDIVRMINEDDTSGFTVDQAVERIRGEAGTTVKLAIERDGDKRDVSVTREEISSPSVSKEITDGVGVVTVTRFDQETPQLVREAAEEFKRSEVKGVVLDMRGNPGGYLTAARDVAGIWLNRKVVVVEKEGDTVVEELKSGGKPVLENMPTVVLVDGNSASASEIVAGALQDHGAATLLGETTYGKGSVQRIVPLMDGAMLKVTVARWFTPEGKNITKEGIAPDHEVKITEKQLRDGDDVQLKAALKRLK